MIDLTTLDSNARISLKVDETCKEFVTKYNGIMCTTSVLCD